MSLVTRQWPGRAVAAGVAWAATTYLILTASLAADATALLLAATAGCALVEVLRWRATRLTVTATTLQIRSGLLPHIVSAPLRQVSCVSHERGVGGLVFGYGTLHIWHAGGELVITRIPRVGEVARYLDARLTREPTPRAARSGST